MNMETLELRNGFIMEDGYITQTQKCIDYYGDFSKLS
jgi:hypothetical protein